MSVNPASDCEYRLDEPKIMIKIKSSVLKFRIIDHALCVYEYGLGQFVKVDQLHKVVIADSKTTRWVQVVFMGRFSFLVHTQKRIVGVSHQQDLVVYTSDYA